LEINLRKRTKLALSLGGAATVAGLFMNTASAAGDPQNFVLVSNHDIGVGHPTVHIEEHAADGSVLQETNPDSGTHWWSVNAGTAYLTVSKGGRTFRIPDAEGATLNQSTDLPRCYRVTNSGELHYVTDQPCHKDGSEGSWR
jgi:hypothetical protein